MCDMCNDTNIILSADCVIGNRGYFADIKYNHADNNHDISIEVGYLKLDEHDEKYSDWSQTLNLNYCPYCGDKKLREGEFPEEYLWYNGIDDYLILEKHFENVRAVLILNLEEKRFELELFVDNKLMTVVYSYIKYNPLNGDILEQIDKELIGSICDILEDFMENNKTYINMNKVILKDDVYDDIAKKLNNLLGRWKDERNNETSC